MTPETGSKKLKPANQNPDFGKVCSHGQLKRQCYTCELEEELDSLRQQFNEVREMRDEIIQNINDAVDYVERHPDNAYLPISSLKLAVQKAKAQKEKE